jgi:hypothetical protein
VWIADVLPNELVAEICLRVERGGHHHKADAGERSQERLASVLTSRRHPPRRSRANRCTGSWAILEIPTEQRDKPREVGAQSAGVRQVLGTLDLISNCRDRTQDSRLSAHARVFDGAHAPLPSALPSGLPSESASDALTLRYVNVQGYHAAAEKWRRIKEMRQRVDDAGTMHVSV